ncbi:hypothetical protein M9458_016695, partial [Cirrhinus mrigala]
MAPQGGSAGRQRQSSPGRISAPEKPHTARLRHLLLRGCQQRRKVGGLQPATCGG